MCLFADLHREFAARQQIFNLAQEIPISIWYDWKNDGDDPSENEHNFGLVYPDLIPKPAYNAIKTLTRELGGCRIWRRVALPKYELVATSGDAHEQMFSVECVIDALNIRTRGKGTNRRMAEQQAATQAFEQARERLQA